MEGEQYHSERAWVFCQVLGVIWVNKTKLMPEAVIDKNTDFPLSTFVLQLVFFEPPGLLVTLHFSLGPNP